MSTATANAIEENMSLFMATPGENGEANQVAQFPKADDLLNPNPNVIRVMSIVPDKQDYSFVEKVQLPENEVLSLCNKLVPTSASAYLGNPPRTLINFKALNGLCLTTVGIYGDKKMMIQIFRKQCLIGDSVLSQMEGGLFEPGLYVIAPDEAARTVVAFSWHEGKHFKEASRKDVSCNFIRYLVELCQCVYICVEGSYNFGALTASATREPSKSGRTRKFELKKVMNSKDDMELLPGFRVEIAEQVKVGPGKFLPIFFCEGYHRCCFLTAEERAPQTSTRTQDMSMKASEFRNILDNWSRDSSVDYTRMCNQDFINLLQFGHPGEYQNYCKWKDSFKTNMSAQEEDLPNAVSHQEHKILANVRNIGSNVRNIGGKVIKLLEPDQKHRESEKEKRFKQGEDSFLLESKRRMSTNRKDSFGTIYIEDFAVKRQSSWSTPWSHNEVVELKVKVSIVEEHQFAVILKACELTPMKKDLIELNSNSEHPIVPTCRESVELVAITPDQERLFKIVALMSGELLVFIHNFKDPCDSCLYLYRCRKIGSCVDNMRPIHTFKRGFDLLSVDEGTRYMALYDKKESKIGIYRFDESFKKVYGTGVEVRLETYQGSKVITWMHLIPGKMELLLVDDKNKVRVVEIHQKPTMRAKHISIPWAQPLSKACVSADGYFLIIFRKVQSSLEGEGDDGGERNLPRNQIHLEIFVLGDRMSFLKTIYLDANSSINMSDLEHLEVNITNFESQSHLVLYNHANDPSFLSSHILRIVLAGEVLKLQHVQNKPREMEEMDIDRSCSYLAYIYHIFDKFGTTPALFPEDKRSITFKVLLENSKEPCDGDACIKYLQTLLQKLRAGKDKDFSNIKIDFQAETLKKWETESACLDSVPAGDEIKMKMGMWVRKLICLVPLQIARAENNGMVALKDGLQIPHDINYVDSVSLANSLRFGFYDAVLNSWKGKIKVISSMGKQSSGKSFLLNHLSGSLLDVSGGRCTDGVWMTIATTEDEEGGRCLYVLLDFEGLGSFERSEQEDMLLSVLNAAVSNLTIFNKKDFHLDKDTDSAFKRFQGGINLIKQDQKLFKGLFYIAIKDVDGSDIEELMQEFNEKISQICNKSQENFILKMYDGNVEIAAMAPYNRFDYYRGSLSELAGTVKKTDSFYDNGYSFLRDLKLLIAQIAAKDWTPIESKRVALIVDILRRNLMVAINMGCVSFANTNEVQGLVNFDTQEEIPDLPVVVGDFSWVVNDQGLFLAPSDESSIAISSRDVLSHLRSRLETLIPRKGNTGEWWHSMFESFLQALGDRRHNRVQQWLRSNTVEYCDNEDVKRLQLEANVALAVVKHGLSVCGCKCSHCFYRCMFEKGHDDDHSCMGDHKCAESCTYCGREGYNSSLCGDLAGHDGSHDCQERNHTCGVTCHLFEMSSNCNEVCSLRPGHPGKHKCNSPHHMCKEICSLPSCNNPCVVAIEPNHEKHQCHETSCQSKCSINGCSRTCGVKNHFHDLNRDAEHLCGNEHACPEECGMPGICEIFTELVRQPRIFEGQRGAFEYECKSEQKGLRKSCCISIPPFERNHQGPHIHTKNVDSVHYCDTRCEACGYFCQLPIDHDGFHNTVHGNMKNVKFVSEVEDIEIVDRRYKWGEKGEAEMCNLYCRKQGRGHIHLVPCPGPINCTGKLYDGSRHETVKYGPDVDVPKDEMTHDTYWEYARFVDPCTEEERQEFGLCNHYCKHKDHEENMQTSDKSYCTREIWHSPLTRRVQNESSAGYITDDGHHFDCRHFENVPYHVIFVIDKSNSMGKKDISPTMKLFSKHNCRLGCVYEAILRFIQIRLEKVSNWDTVSVVLFDGSATVAVEMQDMEETIVGSLLQYRYAGFLDAFLTNYSSGLDVAMKLMMKAAGNPEVKNKRPVVIFLSDGGDRGPKDPVECVMEMKREEPRMSLHTILFGDQTEINILQKMAESGDGEFHHTLDEMQLAKSFVNMAESLKSPVAGLI